MARNQSVLEGMLTESFEAGVANPRAMAIFTLFLALFACVLHWLWKPLGAFTPIAVFVLWFLTAAGVLGVIKGLVVQKARLKRLAETEEIEHLQQLTWQQFEQLVADAYRARGYKVEERGGTADGGIDLLMRSPTGERVAVQCKRWKEWQVGAPRIREFAGAMAQERVEQGVFITSGKYTKPAKEAASKTNVQLVDGNSLLEIVKSTRG
jgi:restriction system protein